jgi:iron complex transport system ATP-binding protein
MHDLNLAARFADHRLLMRQGRSLARGPTEQILASPARAETHGVTIEPVRAGDGTLLIGASPEAGKGAPGGHHQTGVTHKADNGGL